MAQILCDAPDCGILISTRTDSYLVLSSRVALLATGDQVDAEFYFDDRDCLMTWLRRNPDLREVTT